MRKTYKVFVFFVLVIGFFIVYNTYLVDHSVVNLRIALAKAAQAQTVEDFEAIKPLLKVPIMKEAVSAGAFNKDLVSLEMTKNVASTAKRAEQIKDMQFYLKSVVDRIEKKKGALLTVLDRLNAAIYAPAMDVPKAGLASRAADILKRIEGLTDKARLQEAYFELGNIYIQMDDLAKAEETLSKAIEMAPETDMARKARFNIAWAYKAKGDYDKALEYFEDLAKKSKGTEFEVAGKYQIADALYKKGDFEKARDEYVQISKEYMKAESADLALFQASYVSFYDLNDPEAAAKYGTELSEKFSDTMIAGHMLDTTSLDMATDFRYAGYDLLDKNDYAAAIDNFKKAVGMAPKDGVSYAGMGIGYFKLNDRKASLEMAHKAVEVGLKNEVTAVNALYLYIENGKIEEAIMIGKTTLAKGKLPEFFYNLGCAYDKKNRVSAAIGYYRRALKLNPKFGRARNNLGCDYLVTGNYIGAMDEFRTASALEPNYVEPRLNLGICYLATSRLDEARVQFQMVLGLDPANKKAKDLLRKTEEKMAGK